MRVRHVLTALAVPLLLVGCAPTDAPEDPTPSGESSRPSASAPPSASAEPEPEPQRFDGVDLAATLVPTDPALTVDGAGPWTAASRDAIVPGLDAAAFAAFPECQDAVAVAAGAPVVEVVEAGYEYDGAISPSIVAGRMPSPEVAAGFVADLSAAATTCDGLQGDGADDQVVVLWAVAGSADGELADAGLTVVLVALPGEPEPAPLVLTSLDELVVLQPLPSGPGDEGSTQRSIDAIEQQIAALEAAAG